MLTIFDEVIEEPTKPRQSAPPPRPVPLPSADTYYARRGFTDDDAYDDFRERTR